MKLALIGGTGMVGRTMLKILEERKFPIKEIVVVGSEKSIGKKVIQDDLGPVLERSWVV